MRQVTYDRLGRKTGPRIRPCRTHDELWKLIEEQSVYTGNCTVWAGYFSAAGYGQIAWKKQHLYIHRLVYERMYGPIPKGLEIDHICHNRICVNPAHLEAVTRKVNLDRGFGREYWRQRWQHPTHCKNGHIRTGENTKQVETVRGGKTYRYRFCLDCAKLKYERRLTKQRLKRAKG